MMGHDGIHSVLWVVLAKFADGSRRNEFRPAGFVPMGVAAVGPLVFMRFSGAYLGNPL